MARIHDIISVVETSAQLFERDMRADSQRGVAFGCCLGSGESTGALVKHRVGESLRFLPGGHGQPTDMLGAFTQRILEQLSSRAANPRPQVGTSTGARNTLPSTRIPAAHRDFRDLMR